MLERITGKVWKLGDNVDTDAIYPGKYLPIIDASQMAQHALEGLDAEFPKKIKKGDIIVAGANFGCGSSREQAATSLKYAGIACVVAKSFSRIFFRNAINQGLALVQSKEAHDLINQGDDITIDFASGEIATPTLKTQNSCQKLSFPPLPQFVMGILEDGGLIQHVKKTLKLKR